MRCDTAHCMSYAMEEGQCCVVRMFVRYSFFFLMCVVRISAYHLMNSSDKFIYVAVVFNKLDGAMG